MNRAMTTLAAVLFGITTSAASADGIVVSSKIDTEGGLLGNIIYLSLENAGLPVQDRLQLGGTSIMRDAIIASQIDIYPEYTGNAAFFFNEADSDVWKDPAAAYARAAELDLENNDIVWLTPSPANNTWALAIRTEIAEANDLKTMSDFGRYVSAGGDIKLVASSEFVSSPAALPAFEATYGFTLGPSQLIQLSGGDTAATIAAAAQQTSGANTAMVYGTDGGIAVAGLTVLEDDLGVQPVYQATPIVRGAILEEYPEIADILKPIFADLDLSTLQELNGRIQVGGEPAAAVAKDHLTRTGVLE